jgi:dimethylaniline monooxygenase (N-oxide forming)
MNEPKEVRRLAIIGAGSSGLITLKYALDMLPGWEIDCFEQSDSIRGVWGNPYAGFNSTSTKYTTQFSCYPQYDSSAVGNARDKREFFQGPEYGDYLNQFADHFDLRRRIRMQHQVTGVARDETSGRWRVAFVPNGSPEQIANYDAVVICTSVVAEPRNLADTRHCPQTTRLVARKEDVDGIVESTVVVVGGGELGADFANRLAEPARNNRVYLSLRSGIRVSPRYHPIHGVPSDFLRNRLLLSIHPDLRNWIGQRFVNARIRYQKWFTKFFPSKNPTPQLNDDQEAKRKTWTMRLNKRAPQRLFDMFHNKSDDFLDAIATDRLQVIGPPVDDQWQTFTDFDGEGRIEVRPDVLVPAVGFRSRIAELTGGLTELKDFYHGCCNINHPGLYLVGYARPVIGNIPSMSEMQARYALHAIAGKLSLPPDVQQRHQMDLEKRRKRFGGVATEWIYPVEMFPYCDQLAREMGTRVRSGSLRDWWCVQTAAATTLDYDCFDAERRRLPTPPTHLPPVLIALLLALKPVDWVYRALVAPR